MNIENMFNQNNMNQETNQALLNMLNMNPNLLQAHMQLTEYFNI